MKKIISLCLILLCLACKTEKDDLIGLCEDPIKLPQNSLEFPSEGGKVETIKLDRDFWWIAGISLDDKENTSALKNIDLRGFFKIDESAFIIEKKQPKSFTIEMKPNMTKKDRILTLMLQSGNCFTYLSVTQSGEK